MQNVGDLDWLIKHCQFKDMVFALDELIVLNCSRKEECIDSFLEVMGKINKFCYAPVAVGGKIKSLEDARKVMCAGADKVVLNSLLFENLHEVKAITKEFGSQSVVGSLDISREGLCVYSNGEEVTDINLTEAIGICEKAGIGEILINNIERDGTGQGIDDETVRTVISLSRFPVIFSGGIGNLDHFIDAYLKFGAKAVTTSNLLNFVGDSILKIRQGLIKSGINLAQWEDHNNTNNLIT